MTRYIVIGRWEGLQQGSSQPQLQRQRNAANGHETGQHISRGSGDAPAKVERAAGRGEAQRSTAHSTAAHVGGATRLADALRSTALQQQGVGEPRRWTRGVLQAAGGSVAADGQQLVHAEKCA